VSTEYDLSHVLSDFARTMVTDFPIQAILDSLVTRIVEILPITSAGVTLISEGKAPRYIAASDEAALRFEQLQTQLGQGPCLLAYATGRAVSVPDLAGDTRFPLFAPGAIAVGMGAVFTFPLRHGDTQLAWHPLRGPAVHAVRRFAVWQRSNASYTRGRCGERDWINAMTPTHCHQFMGQSRSDGIQRTGPFQLSGIPGVAGGLQVSGGSATDTDVDPSVVNGPACGCARCHCRSSNLDGCTASSGSGVRLPCRPLSLPRHARPCAGGSTTTHGIDRSGEQEQEKRPDARLGQECGE
jgi:hypothetical protein